MATENNSPQIFPCPLLFQAFFEGQDMRWVSFDEALKLKLIHHDIEIIKRIKEII